VRKQILTAALCLAACPALAQTFTLTAVPYYSWNGLDYTEAPVIEAGLPSAGVCNGQGLASVLAYSKALVSSNPKLVAGAVGFCTTTVTTVVPGGTLAVDSSDGTGVPSLSLRIPEPSPARCQADAPKLRTALNPLIYGEGVNFFVYVGCV
jgi:hypothetical protein